MVLSKYFPLVGYKVLQSMCMYVCLFVCLLKLQPIFYTCYPWPWPGHSLTPMQYVMYFQFCG